MPGLALFPPAPCARTKRQRGSHSAGCVKMQIDSFLELFGSDRHGSRVAAEECADLPCAAFAFGRAWWMPVAVSADAQRRNSDGLVIVWLNPEVSWI